MKKILAVGNALVDELLRINSDEQLAKLSLPLGSMTLIGEQQYALLCALRGNLQPTRATGGSAANAIKCVCGLGGSAAFVGRIGSDELGHYYCSELARMGVENRLLHTTGHSGVACTFISPNAERTFATYLGVSAQLCATDITPELFQEADIIHIEGYLVQDHALLSRILEVAHQCGALVSMDLASYNIVIEHRDFLLQCVRQGIDILFANEAESLAFTGTNNAEHALKEMSLLCATTVQKRGKRGSVALSHGQLAEVSAEHVKVVDTTAAGDYYAGGFLWALSQGRTLQQCCMAGSLCSTYIIQLVGGTLPKHQWQEIQEKLR